MGKNSIQIMDYIYSSFNGWINSPTIAKSLKYKPPYQSQTYNALDPKLLFKQKYGGMWRHKYGGYSGNLIPTRNVTRIKTGEERNKNIFYF